MGFSIPAGAGGCGPASDMYLYSKGVETPESVRRRYAARETNRTQFSWIEIHVYASDCRYATPKGTLIVL